MTRVRAIEVVVEKQTAKKCFDPRRGKLVNQGVLSEHATLLAFDPSYENVFYLGRDSQHASDVGSDATERWLAIVDEGSRTQSDSGVFGEELCFVKSTDVLPDPTRLSEKYWEGFIHTLRSCPHYSLDAAGNALPETSFDRNGAQASTFVSLANLGAYHWVLLNPDLDAASWSYRDVRLVSSACISHAFTHDQTAFVQYIQGAYERWAAQNPVGFETSEPDRFVEQRDPREFANVLWYGAKALESESPGLALNWQMLADLAIRILVSPIERAPDDAFRVEGIEGYPTASITLQELALMHAVGGGTGRPVRGFFLPIEDVPTFNVRDFDEYQEQLLARLPEAKGALSQLDPNFASFDPESTSTGWRPGGTIYRNVSGAPEILTGLSVMLHSTAHAWVKFANQASDSIMVGPEPNGSTSTTYRSGDIGELVAFTAPFYPDDYGSETAAFAISHTGIPFDFHANIGDEGPVFFKIESPFAWLWLGTRSAGSTVVIYNAFGQQSSITINWNAGGDFSTQWLPLRTAYGRVLVQIERPPYLP